MKNEMEQANSFEARLGTAEVSKARRKSLRLAHERGVTDTVFKTLVDAELLFRGSTIVLPTHRFAELSRGRGWARKGRGASAEWGERVNGGYRVGPGHWVVGGHDGFRRKGQVDWDVKHVTVGGQTWTVANDTD